MKRKCLSASKCPIARTLDVIGDWWSLLIVRDIFLGRHRFSEFEKSLGLAKNILSARLRKLVAHDIVTTAPASDGSAYQEYRLTDKGRGLYLVLVAAQAMGREPSIRDGRIGTGARGSKNRQAGQEIGTAFARRAAARTGGLTIGVICDRTPTPHFRRKTSEKRKNR